MNCEEKNLKIEEAPSAYIERKSMALNGNKAQYEFPYEIKEADADMKEQFIRDFKGR